MESTVIVRGSTKSTAATTGPDEVDLATFIPHEPSTMSDLHKNHRPAWAPTKATRIVKKTPGPGNNRRSHRPPPPPNSDFIDRVSTTTVYFIPHPRRRTPTRSVATTPEDVPPPSPMTGCPNGKVGDSLFLFYFVCCDYFICFQSFRYSLFLFYTSSCIV